MVLEVLNKDQTIGQIAGVHDIHVNMLRKWNAQAVEHLPSLFTDVHQAVPELEAAHERERQELYAEIGRLTTQLAWLKRL